MLAERPDGTGLKRVVPCARRQHGDTTPHGVAETHSCQARAAAVVETNNVAAADASRCGVHGMERDWFPAFDLSRQTRVTIVELPVKPNARLIRDEMEHVCAASTPPSHSNGSSHAG